MGYIGNTPAEKYITLSKQTFTPDSSTVAFTLDNPVANENELALFVNNVRQEPGSGKAYTATGTTLTMSEAPTSGDTMYAVYLGKTMATNTPADGSVTNAMLAGSIATAKLADGSTFATVNGITEADQWRLTTSVTTNGEITSGFERVDTGNFNYIGTGMTESSGVFTFPSTGIYLIHYSARIDVISGDSGFLYATVATDGSTFGNNLGYLYQTSGSGTGGGTSANIGFFDVTNTSTHKIRFEAVSLAAGSSIIGNTSETATGFTFIRLGDT